MIPAVIAPTNDSAAEPTPTTTSGSIHSPTAYEDTPADWATLVGSTSIAD
jgi:hypothetical protein